MKRCIWSRMIGVVVVSAAVAVAQVAAGSFVAVPITLASGVVTNSSAAPATVWAGTVFVPAAVVIQLRFDEAALASDEDAIVVTSTLDGDFQPLDRTRLLQWQNHSARFRGSAVTVELRLAPGSSGEVAATTALVSVAPVGGDAICFGVDDRVLSTEARVCRLQIPGYTGGGSCTGWLINDRSTLFSAGHCSIGTATGPVIAEFNVPLSTATGTPVAPPVQDQYPVDPSSVISYFNTVIGPGTPDDYAVMRLHPNSFGLTASARFGWYSLATALPSLGTSLRLTGFGIDTTVLTYNTVNQTAVGPYTSVQPNQLGYQVDSESGTSGGPITDDTTGLGVAIHTTGACNIPGPLPQNYGTSIFHPAVQSALATVTGCAYAGVMNPGAALTLTCPNPIVDVYPQAGRWNVLSVASASDWNVALSGTGSTQSGSVTDFLLCNGRAGTTPPLSGTFTRSSGTDNGQAQLETATTLAVGSSVSSTFGATTGVRLYEFFIQSGGAYDLVLNGDPSLSWRLYSAGSDGSWRPRTSSTFVIGGTVGGPPPVMPALNGGWYALVVFRDGGPAALTVPLLTVTLCASTPSIGLTLGSPVTVTNACQRVTFAPVSNTWNVVAASSVDDWNVDLGPAQSHRVAPLTDFAVADAVLGSISPAAGMITRAAGAGPATVEFAAAASLALNTLVNASLPAGAIVRAWKIAAPAGGTFDLAVSGNAALRWHLFAPASSSAWLPATALVATGLAGSGLASGIVLPPGNALLVIVRDGGPAGAATPFSVALCPTAGSPLTLSPGIPVTPSAPCQPFTLAPLSPSWQAVGVTSSADWDTHLGTVLGGAPTGACDFAVANGHAGTIAPQSGIFAQAGGNAQASAVLGAVTTLSIGTPATLSFGSSDVLAVFEFDAQMGGTFDVSVAGGSFLAWRLFAPNGAAAWRGRAASILSGSAGGPPATGLTLGAGWHALVVYRDGAVGASASITVTVSQTPNPLPVVTGINPSTAVAGTPSLNVSITGTGATFGAFTIARWNGQPLPTTVLTPNLLVASLSSVELADGTTASLTVYNPPPAGGVSGAFTFTVMNPLPVGYYPTPGSATVGGPAFALVIDGANFVPSTVVHWGATALATTQNSPNQVVATVPAALLAAPGMINLTLVNPAPGGGTSSPLSFSVDVLTVTALVPPAVAAPLGPSSAAIPLLVNGAGFTPSSVVYGNDTPLPTTYLSPAQLSCTIGPNVEQMTLWGAVAITVSNGGAQVSNTVAFRIGNGANLGTIIRIPLDVAPGALFTARLEGAVPNAPFTMIADALNPIALPGFPNGVANFTLGIGGLGVAGFVPLLDGIGVFGAPSGIAFGSSPTATAPGGLLDLVGLSTPNPPIGIGLTIQTIYLDPASPTGWRLGWASRPQNL